MGRRRRRVIRIVKKKLPTVFVCPRCGEEAVRVSIDKATGKAVVACAICQLKDEFQAHPQAQAIDVYSYFTDRFYGVKDPRAIIPRDRPPSTESLPEEPEPEEEEAKTSVEAPTRLAPATESPGPSDAFEEQSNQPEEQPSIQSESSEAGSDSVTTGPSEADEKEEENPFGDILQPDSEKEKKRYSPNPIPQESSSSSAE